MPRLNVLLVALLLAGSMPLMASSAAAAQSSAAKILEKARGQAREIEELRKVLNGPDQNMRLATFDAMVNSGDEALKQIAYEAGLASADSVMRAMAFKALVMSQENLLLTLQPDPSAPKSMQQASAERVANYGSAFVVQMKEKNVETGTFKDDNRCVGQVSGLEVVLGCNFYSVSMTLRDDNALTGVVRINHNPNTQFLATARLR